MTWFSEIYGTFFEKDNYQDWFYQIRLCALVEQKVYESLENKF